MKMPSSTALISPSNLPCVESYLIKWAIVSGGYEALIATIFKSFDLSAPLKTILPILPKPLIAIFFFIVENPF